MLVADPSIQNLILTFVLRVLAQNRHPVQNPPVDEDLNGNDGEHNNELLPVEKFAVREVPVECDE